MVCVVEQASSLCTMLPRKALQVSSGTRYEWSIANSFDTRVCILISCAYVYNRSSVLLQLRRRFYDCHHDSLGLPICLPAGRKGFGGWCSQITATVARQGAVASWGSLWRAFQYRRVFQHYCGSLSWAGSWQHLRSMQNLGCRLVGFAIL